MGAARNLVKVVLNKRFLSLFGVWTGLGGDFVKFETFVYPLEQNLTGFGGLLEISFTHWSKTLPDLTGVNLDRLKVGSSG